MAENITRCPKCSTSFRISDAHLKSAKGAVRCGSCLNIFNAKENLLSALDETVESISAEPVRAEQAGSKPAQNTPTAENNKSNSPATTKAQEPSQASYELDPEHREDEHQEPLDDGGDILISDNMDAKKTRTSYDNDFDESIFENSPIIKQSINLFEREVIKQQTDDTGDSDEAWALYLLENDHDDEPDKNKDKDKDNNADIEAGQDRVNTQDFDTSYHSQSFQIIEEESDKPTLSQSPSNTFAKGLLEDGDSNADEIDNYEYNDPVSHKQSRYESSRYIDAIEPEPVEFTWHGNADIWQSKLLWGALSSLAAVLLTVQIAWIKFDTLSVQEPYRSYYASACEFIGCTLSELNDRSKIRATNLVVRSHPKIKQALVVDAILQNTANFQQTFPSLDLVFTNAQDKTVAAKRFQPKLYLSGELAGRTQMPSKQPILISIEIADPGKTAVGYNISIAD